MLSLNKPTLSYSQITTFLICRKKWYWEYIEDLTPKKKPTPLQIGDLVHRLLDAYYRGELNAQSIQDLTEQARSLFPDNPPEEVEDSVIQAVTLLNGYVQQFEQDELQVTSPEVWLEKDFGDFILTARLDAMCQTPDSRKWRLEHKTTTRVDSTYLQGQRKGLQTGICQWLMDELLAERISGTIFNLLVKKKVPEFPRQVVPRSQWVVEGAKQVVHGVVRSLKRGDLYPSMQCTLYNKPCDFEPLCRSDTPATREAFYTSRKEVMERSKKIKIVRG